MFHINPHDIKSKEDLIKFLFELRKDYHATKDDDYEWANISLEHFLGINGSLAYR